MTTIVCPHCGRIIDDRETRELSPETAYVWLNAPARFRDGIPYSASDLAHVLHRHRVTVTYHLDKLVDAGLVERVPEHPGSTKRHHYQGVRQAGRRS